jgi:hypothetical protein
MTDGMRFEYLHRAAALQYGLVWIDINMRLKDGAMNLIDPAANKWLLSVLAYKACQYFSPKEPHHLGILGNLDRLSDRAVKAFPDAPRSECYAEEAVSTAKSAAHYGRLVLKAFDLLRGALAVYLENEGRGMAEQWRRQ